MTFTLPSLTVPVTVMVTSLSFCTALNWPLLTSTVTLDATDGTHWTYHFRDDTGYEWFDESVIDDHGLTSTATDPGPDGGWVKTTIHFLAAPCYVVDAELAKY